MKENLPKDPDMCHEIILDLAKQNKTAQQQIAKMQHQLEVLLKARFGPRSDRINPDQQFLFNQETSDALGIPIEDMAQADQESENETPKKKKKGHGRNRLPENLPRERRVYDVDPEDKVCKTCQKEKIRIGEETSEQLDYIPASIKVIEHVCLKYACPNECEKEVIKASKPLQAIEKGLPGPGLLSQVVTSKYCDHLPLYRQENILERHGVKIPRSTQCDWMRACANLLIPIWELQKKRVLLSKKIHTDDTPVPVLDRTRKKTKKGRLWVYVGDYRNPYTVYEYTPSRKRDGPVNFLKDYRGYLQADAYGGYDGIYANNDVTEVACWAHARRKFVDCQTSNAQGSITAAAWIKLLYNVEDEARKYRDSLSDEINQEDKLKLFFAKRHSLRQKSSAPTLKKFLKWLEEYRETSLPKSPFRLAVNYTLNHWKALNVCLENGELELDNNIAERAVRGIAIGRRNWTFCGSDRGGKTAAILYSFVSTCKDHGIDPYEYFRDVFTRISEHKMSKLDEFLPDVWKSLRDNKDTPEIAKS